MYRKNETDITKKLLGDCDKTRLIEQSIIKKNADIDNLDKLMSFLGQNACE
jgi:hypothetical protein